ncbi:MAG: hypothetical protein K9M84_11610 [Spirochaetia bacterium]|nr:hypothetical protein [Spirochaetia bacterium]
MISAPRLSFMWNAAMGSFGIIFWIYGIITLLFPKIFAPFGYILAILGGLLAVFLIATEVIAGKGTVERAWDEGTEHDSNRAYQFGFTVAWVVYLVFWLLITRGLVPVEAAFPSMGAFTGGSYCLFMGITGLRGWYETRNTPD